MSRALTRVVSIGPDGTARLEDGREMTLVVADTGALGLRPRTDQDRLAQLDQYSVDQGGPMRVPKISELGLDQVG